MKKCNKCNTNKDYDCFSKDKSKKDGLRTICKKCTNVNLKNYYHANKEGFKIKSAEWRENNQQKIKEDRKIYRVANKERINKKSKEYYEQNKEKANLYGKKYRKEKSKEISEQKKGYRLNNLEKINKAAKKLYEDNINFKIATNLRNRTRQAIKGNYKGGSAVKDLGCSIDFFKTYLESKFKPGMSWKNHGEWHMDHIIPLCSFDLTNREQFLKACHYTNIQPLWKEQNLKKSGKINFYQD